MDELLSEERKESLIEKVTLIVRSDVLTNLDALAIVEILQRACERKRAEICEEIFTQQIEKGNEK